MFLHFNANAVGLFFFEIMYLTFFDYVKVPMCGFYHLFQNVQFSQIGHFSLCRCMQKWNNQLEKRNH